MLKLFKQENAEITCKKTSSHPKQTIQNKRNFKLYVFCFLRRRERLIMSSNEPQPDIFFQKDGDDYMPNTCHSAYANDQVAILTNVVMPAFVVIVAVLFGKLWYRSSTFVLMCTCLMLSLREPFWERNFKMRTIVDSRKRHCFGHWAKMMYNRQREEN